MQIFLNLDTTASLEQWYKKSSIALSKLEEGEEKEKVLALNRCILKAIQIKGSISIDYRLAEFIDDLLRD